MPRSLSRFAADQLPSLEQSLRAMEPLIEGWLTKTLNDGTVVPADGLRWDVPQHPRGMQSTTLRWEFPERSQLLQATRYLTYARRVGHGTLMVARALGSNKEEPRLRLFGVRTPNTSLDWYSSHLAIDDDIVCTRFGRERRGDLRRIAAGLLGCLERAGLAEEEASCVTTSAPETIPTPREARPLAIVPHQRTEIPAVTFPRVY